MERRSRFELTREDMHLAAVAKRDHELTERSSLAN
jgi:hypothetical protein